MRLNLGCGEDVRDGWLNVDIDPGAPADEHMDLEDTPWPWDDGSAEEVLMDNVLEHIAPAARPSVVSEVERVLERYGRFTVRTPVPEIGAGWDLTHHAIPSWRWPHHPAYRDRWHVLSVRGKRVGPGRLIPERVARAATRFWVARCVDEVEVVATPEPMPGPGSDEYCGGAHPW